MGGPLRHDCDMVMVAWGHADGTVEAMNAKRSVLLGLVALVLPIAACSGTADSPDTGSGGGDALSKVVLLGDSVAAGEALPLGAALEAADVEFTSLASDGGGNVVGPFSDKNWQELPRQLAKAEPDVVVYQVTTYDWGSEQQQRAGYRRLLDTVTDVGAKLVFVTMPPIRPDDFYQPHLAELARTAEVARAVAASGRDAELLDAGAVWGDEYRRSREGTADRSADGIHTCPQGAARFTVWLLRELAKAFPGFTPPEPEQWANTGWSADKHFKGC